MTWAEIDAVLRGDGERGLVEERSIVVYKDFIGHPRDEGAEKAIGFPRGQLSDWRFPPRADCSSLHVSEFETVWDVHVDTAHPRCDLLRHIGTDVIPYVLRGLAAAAQGLSEMLVSTVKSTEPVLEDVEGCKPSIVLVGATEDPIERTIDDLTGRLGFSHVYFDPCQHHAGERWIIDYTAADGVAWRAAAKYLERRRVVIDLDDVTARQLGICIRTRLGQAHRIDKVLSGHDATASCVGLIVSCLPESLRTKLEALRVGPCISPNTLALYFGIGGDS